MIGFIENNFLVINLSMISIMTLVYIFGIIKTKSFPVAQTVFYGAALSLTSVESIGRIAKISAITDFKIFDLGLGFFITLLVCELFIAMHAVFFYVSREEARGNKLYQMVPSSIASGIYAYFDRESEVLLYTEHFYNKIKMNDGKAKKWYKKALKFKVDDKEFKYYGFLKYLKGFDDKQFNIQIEFNDFRIEEFTVQKTKITDGKKTIGYILVDKKPIAAEVYKTGANKEFKLQLYHFFDSLNEAVGYYDNDFNEYRLTELMANRLGITDLLISIDRLKEFICEEDIVSFEKEFNQTKGTLSYRYRLKTVSGLEWHEEIRTVEEGFVYSVFRKLELVPNKVKMLSKTQMQEKVESLFASEKTFGVALIGMKKIVEIIDQSGLDFANMIVDNYYSFITDEVLPGQEIYRLSDFEFGVIVEEKDKYEELIRNISGSVSPLIKYDLFYGAIKYRLNNNIGLVNSVDVISKTSKELFEELNEALQLASDSSYAKDFSIYVSKKVHDANYKFEDHVVDIDNKFLDE